MLHVPLHTKIVIASVQQYMAVQNTRRESIFKTTFGSSTLIQIQSSRDASR